MKAPIIPTWSPYIVLKYSQENYQFYGIVRDLSLANYTACFEEHSWNNPPRPTPQLRHKDNVTADHLSSREGLIYILYTRLEVKVTCKIQKMDKD